MSARALARDISRGLNEAGIDDAALEAELLIRHAGGLTRVQFLADMALDDDGAARARAMAARRLEHEPSAYITGAREFYGRIFEVTEAVLIPRPETEMLVEAVIAELRMCPGALVADTGTGSGCVAISIATGRRDVGSTIGVDRSNAALALARRNAMAHGAHVSFVQGDLATALRRADIVVANLPYIATGDIEALQPEVRDWEPRLALDGGPDGLDLFRRLVEDCGHRLRPGLLALEVGFGQAREVESLCRAAGACTAEVRRDLASIERVVIARWR
jgi:release factor glutamine methyltransferase